jgi:hypothetical protein
MSYFDLSNKKISSLPPIADSIERLYCDNNLLTELTRLPLNLEVLCCNNNLLEQLDELPDNLIFFNCSNNPMTSLPQLPLSLEMILVSPWQMYSCLNRLSISQMKMMIKIIN